MYLSLASNLLSSLRRPKGALTRTTTPCKINKEGDVDGHDEGKSFRDNECQCDSKADGSFALLNAYNVL